ncbi:MAG: hypothetical protein U0175_33950 [Caldilineaceae bacterium]
MNPQRFCDQDAIDEVRSSVAAIRSLAYDALHEQGEIQPQPAIRDHFYTILAHTNRIFALLGEAVSAPAFRKSTAARLPNPPPTYRVMDDVVRYEGASTDTAMVLARPSLIQLVTETVPAVDLDNRHQLMRAIFEMVERSERIEHESSTTALQTQNRVAPPPVTVVDLPSSRDARGLRDLFLSRRRSIEQEL